MIKDKKKGIKPNTNMKSKENTMKGEKYID